MYDYLNEVLLFLAMIILILLPKYLLYKVSIPAQIYIKIIATLFLITLVWLGSDNSRWGIKTILTIVVLASVLKTVKENRKAVS